MEERGTVLLEEEGRTAGREGLQCCLQPSVCPFSSLLCAFLSSPWGTAAGLRRSPWKRSRPCNRAHGCDSCLSVCLEAPPRKVAVSLHPARRSVRIRRHTGPRPQVSPGRAALHRTRDRRREKQTPTCRAPGSPSASMRDAGEGGRLRQLVAELPDLVDTRKRK